MIWHEDNDPDQFVVSDQVQELVFRIDASAIPMDHADALYHEVVTLLPWIIDEPQAGIHSIIHPGRNASDEYESEVFISNRTRLRIRLPKHRLDEGETLVNSTLDIKGNTIGVRVASRKLLSRTSTLFAHRVLCNPEDSESQFMQWAVTELGKLDISANKLLCGKNSTLRYQQDTLYSRSLLVADLDLTDSVRLQQWGLGQGRLLGCGLFVPHKGIAATKA